MPFSPSEVKATGDKEIQVAVMVAAVSHYKWIKKKTAYFIGTLSDVVRKPTPPIVKSVRGAMDILEK
jgi:hypothetical protein